MSSQGQRFRRRALRRGYKVDEVDGFLDRVEATLAGEQAGAPVGAQEVHDVVFRVRFGGYDEWQVDLHLDRVERQLAEFEERGGRPAPEPARGGGMPIDRMGPTVGRPAPPTERLPAPMREERPPMRDERPPMHDDRPPMREERPPMPQRQQMPAGDPYGGGGRYDEPPFRGSPEPGYRDSGYREPAYNEPAYNEPAYNEPVYGGPPQRGPAPYDTPSYDAFEPGRHGKADMTAEIRMPDRDRDRGYGPSPMSAPPMSSSPRSGPPMPSSPMSAPPLGPPMGGGYGGGGPENGPNGELYRIDQLRRTFQPRRFGSGYDPLQVDRLFDGILQAMSGRGPMPVPENELDTLQFGLVPGGYFEAEVDQALREVKDILLRRR